MYTNTHTKTFENRVIRNSPISAAKTAQTHYRSKTPVNIYIRTELRYFMTNNY